MSKRRRVFCGCGWRGRRVLRECACYDENALFCSCRLGGRVLKHAALRDTIAIEGEVNLVLGKLMACHETPVGAELPCVGWLAHQLGPGNNLALRLAVISGRIDANIETAGPQHTRFEDTLPSPMGPRSDVQQPRPHR